MTTKFNKDMYAKMRSKKDEPLSSIGKKGVRVTGKGPSTTLVVSVTPVISGAEFMRRPPQPFRLKRFPLLRRRGSAYQARRRRRRILIRPLYREIKVWLWTGHTELLRPRT